MTEKSLIHGIVEEIEGEGYVSQIGKKFYRWAYLREIEKIISIICCRDQADHITFWEKGNVRNSGEIRLWGGRLRETKREDNF